LPARTDRQRPERLRKRADFLAARQYGVRRRGRFFVLEVRTRDDDGPPRMGITVTRKSGNAVQRNRIRRRLREAIRLEGARDMADGTDYVIIGRPEVLNAPFDLLKAELSRRIRGTAPHGH
jgi:ribonuclease P protein component